MEEKKKEFIEIYKKYITREGSDKLLEYLLSPASDFFTAPASTRFHGNFEGGLCEHSLNVYHNLKDYMERARVKNEFGLNGYTDETIAISGLLHDICKINVYKKGFRNVKDDNGVWQRVDTFEFEDPLPYGHGEKSVYIITGFMKLTREEAFAIRYHMGFASTEDARNIGSAFEKFPLAFALNTADMEATYFLESKK